MTLVSVPAGRTGRPSKSLTLTLSPRRPQARNERAEFPLSGWELKDSNP
jgi:hypothetical protein